MPPAETATVEINLSRIQQNCQQIAAKTHVPVIAVVKADAYGLGAAQVAGAIADMVAGFYVFDAAEALAAGLNRYNKQTIALRGRSNDPGDYKASGIRPVVWTIERAAMLRGANPVLSIDTGQQRFGCHQNDIGEILKAAEIREVMTHATTAEQAHQFFKAIDAQSGGAKQYRKHAAGSALLGDPSTWFDAVRPGLALYADAVRITAPLIEVTESTGPAGYTRFNVRRFGLIPVGYSGGLRQGPCLVHGQTRRILEVGMQTAFVEVDSEAKRGDRVTILGDSLTVQSVAQAWNVTPQEVLLCLSRAGDKNYLK